MARTETKMMGLSFGGEWMPVLKYSVKWCSICIVCATNCHLAWREGGESLDFFLTLYFILILPIDICFYGSKA
jgi:hypothetical protein